MGGAFSFAQGAAARGDPAAAPLLLALGRMSASWAGRRSRRRASFFPLRSCARVAEDGVFCLLYVAFLDTTELTSSISPFARFLRPLSGFYSGDAVAFSFSFIS